MGRPSALGEAQMRLCYFWSQIPLNQERGHFLKSLVWLSVSFAVLDRRAQGGCTDCHSVKHAGVDAGTNPNTSRAL